jgi:hypothetical protein
MSASGPGLYWRIHPDAAAWAPSPVDRQRLADLAPADAISVVLWPRSRAREVVGVEGSDYAFRAVSRGPEVIALVDGTETPASLRWLLAHELGHQQVRQRGLHAWLQAGAPTKEDPKSDTFHALDPEERWADGLATNTFGERLDRAWWRARTPKGTRFGSMGPAAYGRCC